jgi:hypothetical protein
MWMASRLIKRDGKLPGGLLENVGVQLMLEGLVYWAIEYALSRVWPLGEELVLEATK